MTSAGVGIIMGIIGLAVVLAGIAALVLFIVGVVTKKTGMWVSGLILGVVAATTVVGFFIYGFYMARRATNAWVQNQWSQLPASSGGPLGSPVTTSDDLRAWFSEATGAELPEDVELLETQEGMRLSDANNDPFPATIRYMKLSVPATFVEALEPTFKEAAWQDVRAHLTNVVTILPPTTPQGGSVNYAITPIWTDAEVQGLTYYAYEPAETAPGEMFSYAVYVAYDKDAAVAYVAGEEKMNIDMMILTGNGPRTERPVRYAPAGRQETDR